MKKERIPFDVYSRYYLHTEDPEDGFERDWTFEGDTWAVSEKQAVNNVRHRNLGDISQYKPIAVGGHWDNGLEWKAVKKGDKP